MNNMGIDKTGLLVRKSFYWVNMNSDRQNVTLIVKYILDSVDIT